MPWPGSSPAEPLDEVRVELGRALRELRREQGLSQQALEDLCGLDQSIISRLEAGHEVKVRLARFLNLLGALGVDHIALRSKYEGATIAAFMDRHTRGT
jgi:transcriptional regulator with XRE-family HTH domain